MSNLITSAVIGRPVLQLPALDLVHNPYKIEGEQGLNWGGRRHDRIIAKSPFVEGGVPTHQNAQMGEMDLIITVKGKSVAEVMLSLQVLLNAFYQARFTIVVGFEGFICRWQCYKADAEVGNWDERWKNYSVPVHFQVPRQPIPLDGPM